MKGLELALQLHFPEPAAAPGGQRRRRLARQAGQAAECDLDFVVYCDKPVEPETQAAVARIIEVLPVQATYRLRVKAAAKKRVES